MGSQGILIISILFSRCMMTHAASQTIPRIYIPRGNLSFILVSNGLHILLSDVRMSYGFDRCHMCVRGP